MTRLSFLICLFFIPLALQAQVYRCETSEGTIYSQMPCAENAERLEEYDAPVDSDETSSNDSANTLSQPAENQPSAMENFITTLEKQRADQFRMIDGDIKTLRDQLSATGSSAPDDQTREAMESELERLTAERASIGDQYAAMISEANNRTVGVN